MKHHIAKPASGSALAALREDPALRAIYRAKSLAELNTLIEGLTLAQRTAALNGLLRLAWIQLRQMR